ncbi:MAG TPA: hypothetical protein VK465_14935, partial [Fibrobacteria bacterium]|nr:hypothetical protein [Fibrobacteria bacterium]
MTDGRPFALLLGTAFVALASQAVHAAPPPCPTPADSAPYLLETWPPAASTASGRPADPSVENETLAAYAQLRSAAFMGWARSGIHVVTRMGIHPQLYRLASPLADRRQVTFFRRRAD